MIVPVPVGQAREPDPQRRSLGGRAVAGAPFVADGELVAQGEVFEGELPVGADEEGEEAKQFE